ncbi:N,N-dimethylformamidase beta subunit family domain-containing protein [Amycolatopsis jejuensis]|uniref:N,N-dimethylformamidase beta subunit family domain-containing protein n=1 Tax=Amycolatopsis jejuensis TaxID=330084 RepID=UPI00068BAB8A|nr:N,N-dimethylformamidase beta subunit family domain-containing protein [Amycolatopsis jejuensis]
MTAARGERPGDETPSVVSGISTGARRVWVEIPDLHGAPGAWCYSDRRSYSPGETVTLFVSSTEPALRIRIRHDGGQREEIHDSEQATAFQAVPEYAYRDGCGWAPTAEVSLGNDVEPGTYLVELSTAGENGGKVLGHHLFVVKPAVPRPDAIALVLATSTWAAYNDWGGANHYFGRHPGTPRGRSPILSAQRPWARGQVWLPPGAPRWVNETRPKSALPARYEAIEWANLNSYSKYYAAAGWATFERHFVQWAEAAGYRVDVYTQDDLHGEPGLLDAYRCASFIGHDEYWTAEMRAAVDSFVTHGGRVARFAGNFTWQIRLEDGGQVAYKYDARDHDPITGTDRTRMTGAWEDPLVGNPGATTFGVNALRGLYAAFGGMAPRAARGFTVFRPAHWALRGTGLGYGDMFGDESNVFSFEMDGLDYEMRDGLPHPRYTDGAPETTEILAMNWATAAEDGLPEYADSLMIGDGDARFRAAILGEDGEEGLARSSRGSGMIVAFTRGEGEVFTAATCEWVNGLRLHDPYVEAITHNILGTFLTPRPA